jgi:hypothetical protein
MRKWRLPLTYQPKIEPVLLGTCRQTIRKGWKKQVGDQIRFFVWTGKPYRSKQIDLTEYELLVQVVNCKIFPGGITRYWPHQTMKTIMSPECFMPWTKYDCLAQKDGIVPPTGEELGRILSHYNKIPAQGIEAQILRW